MASALTRTRTFAFLLLMLVLAAAFSSTARAQGEPYEMAPPDETVRGLVLEVEETGETGPSMWGEGGKSMIVEVQITSGTHRGEVVLVEHHLTGNPAYDVEVSPGDRVLLGVDTINGQVVNAYITDFARERSLAVMGAVFMVALLIVGGLKGLRSVIVLALTGLAVIFALIPMIISGWNPVLATVLISSLVIGVGLVIVAGPQKKTLAAIVGTTAGVIIAGVMASLFGSWAHLLGLGSQEAQMLMYAPDLELDFRGLLFAGMILGSLGAVMDVGMSIASAVDEVHQANPALGLHNLVRSGMNVGRDVLGTMANTLVLAYAGASLPLLLLLTVYHTQWSDVINLDIIATEVIRALSGSTGLVICVPVTALVAGLLNRGPGARAQAN